MRRPMLKHLVRSVTIISCTYVMASANAAECTCRGKDVVASEGETVCLSTPNGSKLAVCQKVLNNTSWKFLPESCGHWVTQSSGTVSGSRAGELTATDDQPDAVRRRQLIEQL
ncbi:MAG: hypothetical protein ACR2RL_07885 [Gammaproteobacteria bacterium]